MQQLKMVVAPYDPSPTLLAQRTELVL